MSFAYIRPINPSGPLVFAEIIAIGPVEGVPPRPTPGPTPPGPVDPGYSPPWAQVPGPGGPGGPGGPVDPGYSPPWAQIPETPGPGTLVLLLPMPAPPEGTPPATPPAGMPAGSTQHLVYIGKGSLPAMAWVSPYASTGPVTPPPSPAV